MAVDSVGTSFSNHPFYFGISTREVAVSRELSGLSQNSTLIFIRLGSGIFHVNFVEFTS